MSDKIFIWTKREFVYVIILLFALLACLIVLYNAKSYENKCNEHWLEQMDEIFEECPLYYSDSIIPFNESFEWNLPST